jgi:hypothetical protein
MLVHLDAVENSLVGDDYSVVEFLFVGSFDVVGLFHICCLSDDFLD